ncbi:copper resistance CopC/CopD family protein [Shinella pollutisoli]|uniref:Copper resistance CopC/CopD family protein n=1 Tax=Shinella pollutisoli TaxID=2250594 RepID=A0ABV7DE59_9HYPH|nr:copper resistance CopC/CopD family protein [Shinella pollutisoli]
MIRRLVHLARLVPLVLLALTMQVAAASAHASLTGSEPADGTVVAAAPEAYSLTFSEPVSPLSLRLVGPNGGAVELDRFDLVDRTLRIAAPAGIGRGTHVLSWRVVSEDGHPVGGALVFSIGAPSEGVPQVADGSDRGVQAGLWLCKIALFLGLFAGCGGVFARRVLMPGIVSGRGFVAAMLLLGAAGTVLSIGFQGRDALGAGHLGDIAVWSAGLATSYGRTVAAALVAFALAGTALRLTGRAATAAASAVLLLAGLAPALSGHASAAAPQVLMRPAVFLHAAGIAVWIGALVPLGLALSRGEAGAAAALRRFSRAIAPMVAVLVLAGIALAVVQVGQPGALLDTAYGQVFLVKLALLAVLFLLAAMNRWGLTAKAEAGDPAATRRLARSIAAESLIVLLVFGAAATWRFTPPPRVLTAAAAVPATVHIHSDKAMAEIVVTPGRAGPVSVTATLLTHAFEPMEAKGVSFVFSNPAAGIEPFKRQAERQADGTWRSGDVVLPLAGEWSLRVDVLVSDFEILRLTGTLAVRP